MKSLLAISWEMPPLTGPRATQVARTMVALAKCGWRSRTICFGPRSNRYNQDGDVSVERSSGGHAALVPVASPEEWFAVRALWRLVPPLKHLPDEKRVWMPGALRAARAALAAEPADVIASFAQPWSDHLIGLQLKKEYRLPWVAHFSDPWADSPYQRPNSLVARQAATWEHQVVEAADRVVFVNTYTRDRVMAKYPDSWRARSVVVPQGHEGAPTAPASVVPSLPIRIVYTGRFYDGLRTPETFLHALAAAQNHAPMAGRIHVTFVGAGMQRYEQLAHHLGIASLVAFPGRLSPRAAMSHAAEADLLLVIDSPTGGEPSLFLPSKLIDYLPLQRPIIGITPTQGPTADLLRELGYPVRDPRDASGMAALLASLSTEAKAPPVSPQHVAVSARFHITETTSQFAGVLEDASRVA